MLQQASLGCDYGQNLETQPSTFNMGEAMLEPPATVDVANNLDWWNINKGRLARHLGEGSLVTLQRMQGWSPTCGSGRSWPRTYCEMCTDVIHFTPHSRGWISGPTMMAS
jgi:hypothetical protein